MVREVVIKMIPKIEKYNVLFAKYLNGDEPSKAKGNKLTELLNQLLDLCLREIGENVNLSKDIREIITTVFSLDSDMGEELKRAFN